MGYYRCNKCGTEYRPLDAGPRQFRCCGVPLERITSGQRTSALQTPASTPQLQLNTAQPRRSAAPPRPSASGRPNAASATTPPQASGARPEVLQVIPPRENMVDVLAVQSLISNLSASTPFSLEIAGDARSRRFLLRAPHKTLAHLRGQVQSSYDQAEFRPLVPDQDPARRDGLARLTAEFTLRRPVYLPLRTFRDGEFAEADPIRGLLGGFAHLQGEERMLAQLVLAPAPPNWADRYVGSARQIEHSYGGGTRSHDQFMQQFVGFGVSMLLLGACLWEVVALLQHHWVELVVAGMVSAVALAGFGYALKLMADRGHVDPELIREKTATTVAYNAALRLVAFAETTELARARLRDLARAYSQYNLSNGNALVVRVAEFDPRELVLPRWAWWQEWLGHGMRLNAAEIAAMWHLPVGFEAPWLEYTRYKRLLPLPATVAKGVLIGHSTHQGISIPVHIDPRSLWHHTFMVAKTQKGKSTLMAHLAAEAMHQDSALVVIDPHGDLARTLTGLVPRERVGDVVYVDFSDSRQVVGLNLLDITQGQNPDQIVSNLVHVGSLIWQDNWGPRMEDAFRNSLRTLIIANQKLASEGRKEFTLIDIPTFFELESFRRRLLEQYIGQRELVIWWGAYFEQLYDKLSIDVINPVLTKIHRFSGHSILRNIVGQSKSTVNFREILEKRQILLVNTATGIIGPDAGGLLGAVIVDYINFAVRSQMALTDMSQRARVVIVVDEFQSIPGVDYPALLGELQKMGASFILATQALGQLDALSSNLPGSILSNTANLFVFQTSAADADFLRHELDNAVSETDIINLPDHTCYLKTEVDSKRLPVISLETLAPRPSDPGVQGKVIEQMGRYTLPADVAEAERHRFEDEWYKQEIEDLQAVLHNKAQKARNDLARSRSNARKSMPDAGVDNPVTPPESSNSTPNDQTGDADQKDKPSKGKGQSDDAYANP